MAEFTSYSHIASDFCGKRSCSDDMSAAAGDREFEIPVDNGKEECGSACSEEDNKHVSGNIRITVCHLVNDCHRDAAVALVIIKFSCT